jgi:hypothetical protein
MGAFETRKRIKKILRLADKQEINNEDKMLLLAKLLIENVKQKNTIVSLKDVEFKVFSQWGDDGIIQWLIHFIDIPHETFIEFGVQDYQESNTRFLMMNNNWSGFVMDGSEKHIVDIKKSGYYWKYELEARLAFVDCDNINDLILSQSFDEDVGLLHIDIDGNDYWIWKEINVIKPIIVIIEYNSIFGIDRAITIPYEKDFYRTRAHYSNLYYGASLRALHHLADQKGYTFIGCNSAGNNAYFIQRDKLNNTVKEVTLEEGYVLSKTRESRDKNGRLTHVSGKDRLEAIRDMPVYNILTEKIETL